MFNARIGSPLLNLVNKRLYAMGYLFITFVNEMLKIVGCVIDFIRFCGSKGDFGSMCYADFLLYPFGRNNNSRPVVSKVDVTPMPKYKPNT